MHTNLGAPAVAAKFRLKIGEVEVEYEGEAAFLQDGLINLVNDVAGKLSERAAALPPPKPANPPTPGTPETHHNLSTDTIASKLSAKTGGDLVIAAAAHLALVKGQARFTRKEIMAEIKQAQTHYKASHGGNLGANIKILVKSNRLNLVT
jgi:hypothetical protein